jgi:L-fucose isomerase-like protein
MQGVSSELFSNKCKWFAKKTLQKNPCFIASYTKWSKNESSKQSKLPIQCAAKRGDAYFLCFRAL